MLLVFSASIVDSQEMKPNGFDLSRATIPRIEIQKGGPDRDGIPSIDNPKFAASAAISFLKEDDLIFRVTAGEVTRGYPLKILVWHEIVNDTLGKENILITYCPLCGTAMAFNREIDGKTLTFGVSGLLYSSDVLMYDRETESLWTQLGMKCVSGEQVDTGLEWIEGDLMTWAAWKKEHPDSEVLTSDTGFHRRYGIDPYENYPSEPQNKFPVHHNRDDLPIKAWVAGAIIGGQAIAFDLKNLEKEKISEASVLVKEKEYTFSYNSGSRIFQIKDQSGKVIPSVQVYWFAWQAFYPETLLWNENSNP